VENPCWILAAAFVGLGLPGTDAAWTEPPPKPDCDLGPHNPPTLGDAQHWADRHPPQLPCAIQQQIQKAVDDQPLKAYDDKTVGLVMWDNGPTWGVETLPFGDMAKIHENPDGSMTIDLRITHGAIYNFDKKTMKLVKREYGQ
jgi:hypothetical protein